MWQPDIYMWFLEKCQDKVTNYDDVYWIDRQILCQWGFSDMAHNLWGKKIYHILL